MERLDHQQDEHSDNTAHQWAECWNEVCNTNHNGNKSDLLHSENCHKYSICNTNYKTVDEIEDYIAVKDIVAA